MARGLSDLQKWMLVRALENAESDICKRVPATSMSDGMTMHHFPAYEPEHLTRKEIRAGFYKMLPVEPEYEYEWALDTKKWAAAGTRYEDVDNPEFLYPVPGTAVRSHRTIEGAGDRGTWIRERAHFVRNPAINLAITRAHARLRRRGLATDQVGFWLTDKGRDVARLLATPRHETESRVANNTVAVENVREGSQ